MLEQGFVIALFLACFWGIGWACVLQFTERGRWLAIRRTWVTVVTGIGVDLLLLFPIIALDAWLKVVLIVVLSPLGLIFRSLYNEWREDSE